MHHMSTVQPHNYHRDIYRTTMVRPFDEVPLIVSSASWASTSFCCSHAVDHKAAHMKGRKKNETNEKLIIGRLMLKYREIKLRTAHTKYCKSFYTNLS